MSDIVPYVIEGSGRYGADGDSPQLGDYLRVLVRYRRMIMAVIGVGVLLALIYVFARAPVYSAELTLQVDPQSPEYGAVKGVQPPADDDTFFQTQYTIIGSRAVAAQVVDQLSDRQATILLGAPSWFAQLQSPPATMDKSAHREALIDAVRNHLSVHGLKDSQLVKLNYNAPTAALSAHVANLVAESYIKFQNQAQVQITKQAHNWLTGQLDKLRGDLEDSENRLQTYKKKHGLLGSQDLENLTSQKLSGTSK